MTRRPVPTRLVRFAFPFSHSNNNPMRNPGMGQYVSIAASDGSGRFDAYLALPASGKGRAW